MKRNALNFLLLVAVGLTATSAIYGQAKPGDDVVGEWTGESKCVGSNPYCHDEVVVYRFARSKTDPAKITWTAYKIVNDKLDLMGELEMTPDAKHTLTSEFKIPRTGGRGVWSLTVKGDEMNGTLMVYPENEVGRRVHVTRKKRE